MVKDDAIMVSGRFLYEYVTGGVVLEVFRDLVFGFGWQLVFLLRTRSAHFAEVIAFLKINAS